MKTNRKLQHEYQQATREQVSHCAEGEYEVCVLCGAMTNVSRSMPIELRSDYLLGAGQLCHKCAYDILLRKKERI